MNISKLKTAEIADLVNDGKIILNPLSNKYFTGSLLFGKFIYPRNSKHNWDVAVNGTSLKWAGHNWDLLTIYDENRLKRIGFKAVSSGTYLNGIDYNPTPELTERAYRHMMFLRNHFTTQYIQQISDYQLSQPLLIEVK